VAAAGVGSVALPLRPRGGRPRVAKRRASVAKPARALPGRLGAFVVSLPDHPWLDRLVRGRAWIPVLGVLLAGIVATQVEILKLGAGLGHALEQTTALTNQNEQLRDSVATLGDDQRIERLAASMGMVLPPPGAVGYLGAGSGGDVAGALANIHVPNPASFVSLTPRAGDGALVTGPGTSTLPPLPGVPAPPPVATSPATTSGTSTSAGASTYTTTTTTSATSTPSPPAGGSSTIGAPPPATATPQAQGGTTSGPATATAPTSPQSSASTPQNGTSSGAGPSGGTAQTSPAPATGAAAIQPTGSGQPTGGG
jgi:hypothetical protein